MGANLRDTLPPLLKARGWTQQRLADETAIRRTDLNRIATGKREVGPVLLSKIAAALDVPVSDLDPTVRPPSGALSIADRLGEVEGELDWLREWVTRGFDALGVAPELQGAARRSRDANGDHS